jgi:hypothetical protein
VQNHQSHHIQILLSVLLLHPTLGIEVFHTKTIEKKLKRKTRDEVKQEDQDQEPSQGDERVRPQLRNIFIQLLHQA